MLPQVIIIGRPNVGKSTLFNRLVGKRLALVDDQPGVTRDRRFGEAHLLGLDFTVVDTAEAERGAAAIAESYATQGASLVARLTALEAAELATIQWPADGNYTGGDWKEGQKIAASGRGLTWTDKTPYNNGGGCYNCHAMDPKEVSEGTIGVSLEGYGKLRGNSEEIVKYTWGKLWNSKAYNACSDMPRNGYGGILTEAQIRHVMAYLFDPASPVNQ